jgi:hypothetical protein
MESLVIDIPDGNVKSLIFFYSAIIDLESIMSFIRLTYSGQVAKHRMEVKKAVFCETASQVVYRALPDCFPGTVFCETAYQEDYSIFRDCFPGSLPYFARLPPR